MSEKGFRGIIHVHSNYSYDGKHCLREIAEKARAHGLDSHIQGSNPGSNTIRGSICTLFPRPVPAPLEIETTFRRQSPEDRRGIYVPQRLGCPADLPRFCGVS